MFRTLVKTDELEIADHTYAVRYFELRTVRGARRYSAEVVLGPGDRIILDDDSVPNLEARTARLVPATLYSRLLAGRATAALHRGIPLRARRGPAATLLSGTGNGNREEWGKGPHYLRGSTASLSCLAIRALTTVLA